MTEQLTNPPPGFDELSTEEQIEYVQELWNRISSDQEEVPVPDWHRQILRERLESTGDVPTDSWEDVRERLEGRQRE